MKTPRELLLERHRAAEPKLDALRKETVANLVERSAEVRNSGAAVPAPSAGVSPAVAPRARRPDGRRDARPTWRDLLLSLRWHLAGLSAAWLFVMALNLDQSPTPSPALAKQNTPSPQQLLTALRENRRQVLEMTGGAAVEGVPEARRRSEIESPMEMA